jgi:apurinic endonuclease APN1
MCSIQLDTFDYKIGSHISFDKTISKTLLNSLNMGMYTFQIFLGSPQSFTRSQLKQEDIDKCLEIQTRFPTKIFTHAPYVYNLAGSKECLAWSDNDEQDEKTLKVIYSLETEINQVSKFGKGVVLHPGTFPDKEKGCKTVGKSISKINFNENSTLILENMAGQGNVLGSTFEELKNIKDNIDKNKQKHIKFCIDTAHIHGKGLYNLGNVTEIDKMFGDLDNSLGLDNISLFHLNDSDVKLGSKVDRHCLLCEGEIWTGKEEVLKYFLDKTKHHNIPCVMETDPSDMIKFYHKLI